MEVHRRDAEDAEVEAIGPATTGNIADDPLTRSIIGGAICVHRALGPGLLESAYQTCLVHELRKRGHRCESEVPLPIVYDGVKLDCGYRQDVVVHDMVIVEVKSVDRLAPIHDAQLITYLRLSGRNRGLLINFNVAVLTDGIRRRVLDWRSGG